VTAPLLLGLDLGTSSLKSAVIDASGQLLASAAQEFPVHTPRPGWAEQNPEDWIGAATGTMRQSFADAGVDGAQVQGIGLSGQMHGLVATDKNGKALRPAIIWADQRSAAQVDSVYRRVGPERLAEWTANPLATGFMLSSWLWLAENEPEVAKATRYLLLPKDYLRYHLTGRVGTEPSDACSSLLFDVAHWRWSEELLTLLDIDGNLLPTLGQSTDVSGGLVRDVAEAAGLPPGVPVVYGGGDQAMQAVGNGIVEPGMVSCTIGTGGQLLAPSNKPAYDPKLRLHCFCHAIPNRWYLMAATLSAGLSLRWLRDNVIRGQNYSELADAATSVAPGSEGLLFLPHLAGERTPHMDSESTAAWVGLTLRHEGAHLTRAVMEGVVFSLRQGLELMDHLGVSAWRVVASGGGTRHPLWLQLQADILGAPIHQTRTHEAAAVGAALVAGVGVGVYESVPSACAQAVHWRDDVVLPDQKRVGIYNEVYDRFRRLYPALRTVRTH